MAGMSAGLGTEATPETIEFGNTRLRINPISTEILEKFEQAFIERARTNKVAAWKTLVEQGMMTKAELQAKTEEFTDNCVEAGTYAFGSQAMNRALFDQDTMPTEEEMLVKQKKIASDPAAEAKRIETLPAHVKLNKIKLFALMCDTTVDVLLELFQSEEKREEFMMKMAKVWKQSLPK